MYCFIFNFGEWMKTYTQRAKEYAQGDEALEAAYLKGSVEMLGERMFAATLPDRRRELMEKAEARDLKDNREDD